MKYDLEGIFAGQANGLPFLFAIHVRVGALGEQGARFIADLTRIPQGQLGIGAQGHAFLPVTPVITKMPRFTALRGNREGQSIPLLMTINQKSPK
jgi:hypothetical protein